MSSLSLTSKRVLKFLLLLTTVSTHTLLADEPRQDKLEAEESRHVIEETIIIIGTNVERRSHDSPIAITELNERQVQQISFTSQADILRHLPGIKAEGGGGELATNVSVVGMPFTGQYEFTPLLYDGLPAFSTFGLNSSAFDVYNRNDLSVERLEFVRGGITNLFGPASTVGLFNYVSKSPFDYGETSVKLASSTELGRRFDFYHGQEINMDNAFSLSGFFRRDEGPIDTGLKSTGWQLKGIFESNLQDGVIKLYGQLIDDVVQFYLPLPLDGESKGYATGNDGRPVRTLQSNHIANLQYPLLNAQQYKVDIADGIKTEGGSVGFDWHQAIDSWALSVKGKYADYQHEFNLFLDGDGLTGNVPLTQSDYLTARGISLETQSTWQFSSDGQALAPTALVFGNRILDRQRPARDASLETNLTRQFEWLQAKHTLTTGLFYSSAEAFDINVITGYLTSFNDRPKLIHAEVATLGSSLVIADEGLVQPSGFTKHHKNTARREAVYLVDQINWPGFSFDLGFRIEQIEASTERRNIESHSINTSGDVHPLLTQTNIVTTAPPISAKVKDTAAAYAFGVIYHLTGSTNIYGNYSDSFYFPQVRTIQLDSNSQPNSFNEERLNQAELGLKLKMRTVSASLALLHSTLKDRRLYTFINNDSGGITEQIDKVANKANAIQATIDWQFSPSWTLASNATYQDLKFTEFDREPSFIGNRPVRTAKLTWNTQLAYSNEIWHGVLSNTYVGDTFANNANTITLDPFQLWTFSLDHQFKAVKGLTAGISVFNLFDSLGITEGSPRQGDNQSLGEYFVGRPILGRRTSLNLSYRF